VSIAGLRELGPLLELQDVREYARGKASAQRGWGGLLGRLATKPWLGINMIGAATSARRPGFGLAFDYRVIPPALKLGIAV